MLSNSDILDTRLRSALERMAESGRLSAFTAPIDTHLAIAGALKKHDGGPALMFTAVNGYDIPVIGNLLCCQLNCEAAFNLNFRGIRDAVGRALSAPIPPVVVAKAAAQENVRTEGIDIAATLPVLFHTAEDAGRFITAGVVVMRDPETGVYNASYHRLQLVGPNRTAIKLDYGRHLRLALERAKRAGRSRCRSRSASAPTWRCNTPPRRWARRCRKTPTNSPWPADLRAGRSPVVEGGHADLLVPADTEIVLEGVISPDQTIERRTVRRIRRLPVDGRAKRRYSKSPPSRTATKPIYHAINGYGRETVMLRKYVLEASLLKVLQAAVPIVVDAEMTAGGLHRFHAVLQVRKTTPQHNGLQRNAILAAFGALKDLDLVIVVDDDIDIRNPADVEYALATRMEASRDLFTIPGARGHEYVRIGRNGIRAKLGIDATVPLDEKARFRRCEFLDVDVAPSDFISDPALLRQYIER